MSSSILIIVLALLCVAQILILLMLVYYHRKWQRLIEDLRPFPKKRPTTVCDEGSCDVRSQSTDRQAE